MKHLLILLVALYTCETPIVDLETGSQFSSTDLNQFTDSITSRSSWSKAVRFNVYAAPTKTAALTDVTGNYSPTEVGTNLVFQADKGFKGQGISNPDSYINTGVIPVLPGNPPFYSGLEFDNITYGVYIIDAPGVSSDRKQIFGVIDSADRMLYVETKGDTVQYITFENEGKDPNISTGTVDDGLHVFKQNDNYSEYYRISASSVQYDLDDPSETEDIPIYDFWVNTDANSNVVAGKGFDGFIAVSFVYLYLTDIEVDLIKADIEYYLTTIGAI